MIKLEKLHRGNEQNLQKIGEEEQPTIKEKEREQGKTLTNRENHLDLLYPAALAGKRLVVVDHFTVHCLLPRVGGLINSLPVGSFGPGSVPDLVVKIDGPLSPSGLDSPVQPKSIIVGSLA